MASVATTSHVPPAARMRSRVVSAEARLRLPPKILAPREASLKAVAAPMAQEESEGDGEVELGSCCWPRPIMRAILLVRSSIFVFVVFQAVGIILTNYSLVLT